MAPKEINEQPVDTTLWSSTCLVCLTKTVRKKDRRGGLQLPTIPKDNSTL